jgi:hypothetical protein
MPAVRGTGKQLMGSAVSGHSFSHMVNSRLHVHRIVNAIPTCDWAAGDGFYDVITLF